MNSKIKLLRDEFDSERKVLLSRNIPKHIDDEIMMEEIVHTKMTRNEVQLENMIPQKIAEDEIQMENGDMSARDKITLNVPE